MGGGGTHVGIREPPNLRGKSNPAAVAAELRALEAEAEKKSQGIAELEDRMEVRAAHAYATRSPRAPPSASPHQCAHIQPPTTAKE